jgi:hypothetical protein
LPTPSFAGSSSVLLSSPRPALQASSGFTGIVGFHNPRAAGS